MKVIVDDKIPYIRGHVERLAGEVIYLPGSEISAEDVRDAEALLVRTRTRCDRRLLENSRVRFIATATIGYDHLDTRYLSEAGIRWTNCPGCNAASVGQYVRNALLEAERAGLVRLAEATVGIIGCGHVGTAVGRAVRPYVKRIVANDPLLDAHADFPLSDLETVRRECDIITLHTPLTTEGPCPTFHLIDDTFLRSVAKRPLLINAARGGVVDERTLPEALDEGRIRQAVIDTWEGEPDIDRELLKRVFIGTPHIAGYSADGKANATRMTLEALERFIAGDGEAAALPDIRPAEAPASRTGLRYSLSEDSARLKENPGGFEFQRGNYPLRRE